MVLGYLFFFKFSLLTFLRSLPCLLSIKMCKEKIFRIQSMSTAILYVNLRFTVKNYCASSKYTRNPVWWMEVDIDSQLSSISAVSTDLKFEFHNFFWDYRADKTFTICWSGGRVQVWVQGQSPAGLLAITSEGYSRRQLEDLTAKSMAEFFWLRSGTAWADLTCMHKHREFQSKLQLLRTATEDSKKMYWSKVCVQEFWF